LHVQVRERSASSCGLDKKQTHSLVGELVRLADLEYTTHLLFFSVSDRRLDRQVVHLALTGGHEGVRFVLDQIDSDCIEATGPDLVVELEMGRVVLVESEQVSNPESLLGYSPHARLVHPNRALVRVRVAGADLQAVQLFDCVYIRGSSACQVVVLAEICRVFVDAKGVEQEARVGEVALSACLEVDGQKPRVADDNLVQTAETAHIPDESACGVQCQVHGVKAVDAAPHARITEKARSQLGV